MKIHLDFETYCDLDIKDVGLDVYARHPSTEVMMTAHAVNDTPVQWTERWPTSLGTLAAQPDVEWHAFNAQFERIIMKEVLGIDVPIERWRCTMVHAYHLGFKGTLGEIGAQMGLPETKKKMAEGRRLMLKFCKPAPRNHLVDRYTKENAPEDYELYKQYNIQDVVSEREIELLLSRYPMPQSEWELWFMDQRVNDRGLPIDKELVEAGVRIFEEEKRHLHRELKRLTLLDNPNSGPQMLHWLNQYDYPFDNLKAETIDKALDPLLEWASDDLPIEVLRLKQQLARTAGSKWKAFLQRTDWDTARLRDAFQFNAASRTGRWGGRGAQPHNLHRSPEDQDEKIRSMLA